MNAHSPSLSRLVFLAARLAIARARGKLDREDPQPAPLAEGSQDELLQSLRMKLLQSRRPKLRQSLRMKPLQSRRPRVLRSLRMKPLQSRRPKHLQSRRMKPLQSRRLKHLRSLRTRLLQTHRSKRLRHQALTSRRPRRKAISPHTHASRRRCAPTPMPISMMPSARSILKRT